MSDLHGCKRCPVAVAWKPREAFAQPGENGRKRLDTVCRECRAKEATERAAREAAREARRATIALPPRGAQSVCRGPAGFDPGAVWRRCSCLAHEGSRWAPLETFPPTRKGAVRTHGYHCHRCIARRVSAHDKAMRRDAEQAAAWRERRNANQRQWRKKNADASREAHRRYMAKVRADPVRHEALLADARILYRLRRLRRGLPVRDGGLSSAIGAYRLAVGKAAQAGRLPVEPLAIWLDALMEQDGRERVEVADAMGVGERALWSVQHREWHYVTISRADALIWGYGKPLRIPAQAVEVRLAELAAFWQSAPGNGERLIGYLTDAERIVHLAGAVVDRVEDLWPALAD
jgi:hypothetical protein